MSWPFLAAQGCDHTVLPQDCLSAKINLIPYNTVEGLGMVTPLARAAGKISINPAEARCDRNLAPGEGPRHCRRLRSVTTTDEAFSPNVNGATG